MPFDEDFTNYMARKQAERNAQLSPAGGFVSGLENFGQPNQPTIPEMENKYSWPNSMFNEEELVPTGRRLPNPDYVDPATAGKIFGPGWDGTIPEENYAPRESGGSSSSYIDRLEQDLPNLRAQRDAAVRSGGSSAAAGYNTAIAQVQAEIDRYQQQRTDLGLVAQRQQKATSGIYDTQAASADIGLANTRQRQEKSFADVRQLVMGNTADVKLRTVSSLERMGVDPASAEATLTQMDAMEDVYMGAIETTNESAMQLMEAATEVAKAAAAKSKYTTAFQLKVNEQITDMNLQDHIAGLISKKAELATARSRAISGARSAAARDFDNMSNFPVGETPYTEFAVNRYLRDQTVNAGLPISTMGEWGQFIQAALDDHATTSDIRHAIYGYQYQYDKDGNKIMSTAQANMPWLSVAEKDYMYESVTNGIRLYEEGQLDYLNFVGQDPTQFAPNSVARVNANFNNFLDEGVYSQNEAYQMAIDPDNNEEYNPEKAPTRRIASRARGPY